MVVGNLFVGSWCYSRQRIRCIHCSKCIHLEKKKSELISHYEFRKQIALALICPKLHGGKRSDENNEDERTSASATTTERPTKKQKTNTTFTTRQQLAQNTKSKRSVGVNDKTLDPINGDLACRLNHDLDHFPDNNYDNKQSANAKCAMHRWYNRDIQKKDNILICTVLILLNFSLILLSIF